MSKQSLIYHITSAEEWQAAQQKGFYSAPSLASEGFIHCSTEEQIPGVLERYYQGKTNLVRLTIDTNMLAGPVIFEWSISTADTFPHVYGNISLDSVIEVTPV